MDKKYSTYKDNKWIHVPPIDDLCSALKEKFKNQEEENNRLREENKKLKNGIFEKEELARMKKKYNQMQEDYFRGFPISKKEEEAIKTWQEQHELKKHNLKTFEQKLAFQGVSGGCYTYIFTPTTIGIAGEIKCSCGDTFEFRSL